MKAKHIRHTIEKKIFDWIASIDNEQVRTALKDKVIVTGGSIVSLLLGEKVHDFDVYFRDMAAAKAAADYYVGKFLQNPPPKFKTGPAVNIEVRVETDRVKISVKSAGVAAIDGEGKAVGGYQYFETLPDNAEDAQEYVEQIAETVEKSKDDKASPYRPIFLSTNAITLTKDIQLVFRFSGEPDQLHENYDFVHCTNYWTSWNNELVLKPAALEAILARELRYVGSKYPLCSIFRIRKFMKRGWYITAGQILKILMQVNELDLDNFDVLEDQLTGVDHAYFVQVLDALKEKTVDGKIDRAYLVEIIDRMF